VTSGEKMGVRTMLVLTLPTLGFSTGLSLVTTYLPVILDRYTDSATLIGFAIGGEGLFSSLIPVWVGVMSDRIWTKRWGRRGPFMIFAAPFMAASLMLAPFQPGYVPIAVSTFVFFAAYHFYTSPYQSLLPDVTPPGSHGKVQGYQSFMRGGGMFLGMVVAGVLFYRWEPLPFIICSVLIMVFTYLTVTKIKEPEPERSRLPPREGIWGEVKRVLLSVRQDKAIRRFMMAAFLWESTLAALRPFIMLYFLRTLGSTEQTGALLLGLVGVTYMFAGLVSGYLADRYGRGRVMRVGLWVYLGGCLLGAFMNNILWAFIFLPIFGLGGAIVLTLPYAILIRLMPKEHIGQFTGMFSMMRGFANIIAPVVAGGAIDIAGKIFHEGYHEGREYAVIWLVSGVMIAISLFFFRGGGKDDMVNV
jgi:maltose/moltooligosaccharide transporter